MQLYYHLRPSTVQITVRSVVIFSPKEFRTLETMQNKCTRIILGAPLVILLTQSPSKQVYKSQLDVPLRQSPLTCLLSITNQADTALMAQSTNILEREILHLTMEATHMLAVLTMVLVLQATVCHSDSSHLYFAPYSVFFRLTLISICLSMICHQDNILLITAVLFKIHQLTSQGKSITFIWIPSHVGIPQHEQAQQQKPAPVSIPTEISNPV